VNDRRQANGCNFSLTNVRYCVSTTDKYRAKEPLYLLYCSTKKHLKGDDTDTVEKWYHGAMVDSWYHATLAQCCFRRFFVNWYYYRAVLHRAQLCHCKSSVCLSVHDVQVWFSHRLEY